jgi:hypothetical protein
MQTVLSDECVTLYDFRSYNVSVYDYAKPNRKSVFAVGVTTIVSVPDRSYGITWHVDVSSRPGVLIATCKRWPHYSCTLHRTYTSVTSWQPAQDWMMFILSSVS